MLRAVVIALLHFGLYVAAFPGGWFTQGVAEAAFVALLPFIFWAAQRPSWGLYTAAAFISSTCAWLVLLVWLRHVAPTGMVALAGVLGIFFTLWAVWARMVIQHVWVRNQFTGAPVWLRVGGLFAIAAAWVVLEFARSHVFSGFPWLPLAASQWMRPPMLQISSFTGAWGASFLLVLFNTALAVHMARLFTRRPIMEKMGEAKNTETTQGTFASRRSAPTYKLSLFSRMSPELIVGLLPLVVCMAHWNSVLSSSKFREGAFHVAFVQPHIPATLGWTQQQVTAAHTHLQKATAATLASSPFAPNIILWPETATPSPVLDANTPSSAHIAATRAWVQGIVNVHGAPLLMGNMAEDAQGNWANGVFSVLPGQDKGEAGLQPTFYTKRKLVPFGEFVPQWIRALLPHMGILVREVGDIPEGNFVPGRPGSPLVLQVPRRRSFNTGAHNTSAGAANALPVTMLPTSAAEASVGKGELSEAKPAGHVFNIGPLICYEDTFAHLARASVLAGASVLSVHTNSAWFGEEGGSWQHAAHSVLRAIEVRRPTLRVGNAGLSGHINARGQVQQWLLSSEGSPYFRGGAVLRVAPLAHYQGTLSFYVRWGNWFVYACSLYVLGWLAWLARRHLKTRPGI